MAKHLRFLLFIFSLISVFAVKAQQEKIKTIHVMVALCDNQYQGIVKVPKAIGNGQDPDNNLYWGCAYGVHTFFRKSSSWKEVKREKTEGICLERVLFKHVSKPYYLVADAYDGKYIKNCTVDFLEACAGIEEDYLDLSGANIGIKGNAEVIVYIGHNGLMDFPLKNTYRNKDGKERQAIILACASRQYFASYLKSAGAYPLIWTTNLMAPEAYTLHDALETYIQGGDNIAVQKSAAAAYHTYQKCGLSAAGKLLVTGY